MDKVIAGYPVNAALIFGAIAVGVVAWNGTKSTNNALPPRQIRYQVYGELQSSSIKRRRVLVTGGCGFLGRRVVEMLHAQQEVDILVLDVIVPTINFRLPGVMYIRGDITRYEDCVKATKDIDSVIHIASIIPSLRLQDSPILTKINVDGTQNIVNACKENNVSSLIYTSSATVVISPDDKLVAGVDETTPMPSKHIDSYTYSKEAAEKIVLKLASSGPTKVSVLRPACIYGQGDKLVSDYHIIGKGHIVIGEGNCLLDWVYVDNVAEAHILAEKKLSQDPQLMNGQCYFIGSSFGKDDLPKYSYGNFNGGHATPERPLDHWGVRCPQYVNLNLILGFAKFNEALWTYLGRTIDDMLSTTTVLYTQRSYWFNCSKAREHFGYTVKVSVKEGIERIVEAYKNKTHIIHGDSAHRITYEPPQYM